MLRTHCYTVTATRTLTSIKAIALRFAIASAANIGGISSILPQPAYGSASAWLTQRGRAIACDFVTREQCLQTASRSANESIETPRVIAQAPHTTAMGG